MLSPEDRAAIDRLFIRYSNLIDERQISRVAEIFTADALYDCSAHDLGVHRGTAAIQAVLRQDVHPLMHVNVNAEIEEEEDGTVRAFSRCLAILASGATALATYRDVLTRSEGGWRIAERVVTPRNPETIPPFS